MSLSIENGVYEFLIRLDLEFSMSLWKEFQLLLILNDYETFNYTSNKPCRKTI